MKSRRTPYRELRIFDLREPEGKLLIPLTSLIREASALYPNLVEADWTIFRGASGYGEFVCGIEDQLETRASLDVRGESVVKHIGDDSQYFDDVHIRVGSLGIEFGVHDSTFLFFRGPEEAMHAISRAFARAEIVSR